jgi:hypothetical protein
MRKMISGLFIASLVFCGSTFAESVVSTPVEKAATKIEPAATMPKSCCKEEPKDACTPVKVMKEEGSASDETMQKEMTPAK